MIKVQKTDKEWQEELTQEQFNVLRRKATEPPFSGNLIKGDTPGIYTCVACGAELFKSDAQYESTQRGLEGWPSFSDVINEGAVNVADDYSYGMHRIEVSCATCGGHVGHFFEDDSSPTGQHFCVNGVGLDFKPAQAHDTSTET